MIGVRACLVAVATCLALTGCGDDPAPSPPDETATESPVDEPSASETTPVPGADSPDVATAVDDLASRLGVEAADVEVVDVQEVTWTDGSKGCAKKGMSYTMSMVDGSRITLGVDGTTYEYHSGGSGPPFLCERPTQ